jgi:hypothetical protein
LGSIGLRPLHGAGAPVVTHQLKRVPPGLESHWRNNFALRLLVACICTPWVAAVAPLVVYIVIVGAHMRTVVLNIVFAVMKTIYVVEKSIAAGLQRANAPRLS